MNKRTTWSEHKQQRSQEGKTEQQPRNNGKFTHKKADPPPRPRRLIDKPPPAGDKNITLRLNSTDHARVSAICKRFPVPGGGGRGCVSALFRHLERMIIEDWA